MRKIFVILFLSVTFALQAQSSVEDVSKALNALGAYQATLNIISQGESITGEYQVDGELIYLNLEGVEFYSDGELRYQIDNSSRSVIVDLLPQEQSSMLLDNPASAFDSILGVYDEELVFRDRVQSVIQLNAKGGDIAVGMITLVVDVATSLPKSIDYQAEGESVVIEFISIEALGGDVRQFSKDNYPDYEIVDFR
ncbi:MAG: hypothetical protein SNJ33_01730 [Rikenellaceae bacterium]